MTANPISALIWLDVQSRGTEIDDRVCPLLSYLSITLWRIECGGRDKAESCRSPTCFSLSSLYLAVGSEESRPSFFVSSVDVVRRDQHTYSPTQTPLSFAEQDWVLMNQLAEL